FKHQIADPIGFPDLQEVGNMRMANFREQAGFLMKAADRPFVGNGISGEHLQGDSLSTRIFREIDGPHPAMPPFLEEPESPQLRGLESRGDGRKLRSCKDAFLQATRGSLG